MSLSKCFSIRTSVLVVPCKCKRCYIYAIKFLKNVIYPSCRYFPHLLAFFSGALFTAGPTAYISDLVEESDRAQALAMLRTFGDLGLFVGAGSMGIFADLTSVEAAFLGNALFLAATTINVAIFAKEPVLLQTSKRNPLNETGSEKALKSTEK